MCGISGVLNFGEEDLNFTRFKSSVNVISHRGPDDEGFAVFNTFKKLSEEKYSDDSAVKKGSNILSENNSIYNLGLGFRRLSILDLSVNGHQPFFNEEKNICVIFNGEIYNYIEIRKELRAIGYSFKTGTDTEVILYSYMEWGDECLSRFNGMWGIAIYDMRIDKLFCSRDRFGVKPFYFYLSEDKFVFASEIKSIIEYLKGDRSFTVQVNDGIAYDYFINNYTDHSSASFFENIVQLKPSHFISISGKNFKTGKYFELKVNEEFGKYEKEKFIKLRDDFGELYRDSVRLRLRSDVSIGTCLSGGLDSSSVVSVINKFITGEKDFNRSQTGDRQKTFSAVYDDETIDERKFIEQIVKATNCSSHYVFPDKADFSGDIDAFVYQLDEPIAGTSPYAQWNVMKLARKNNVTVLLDGQGADESLGGYEVYFGFLYSNMISEGKYAGMISELSKNFSKGAEIILRGLKYYRKMRDISSDKTAAYFNPDFLKENKDRNQLDFRTKNNLNKKLYEDLSQFILPSLLRFEDRNSMKFSIESRTPFLDYRIIQFLFETEAVYKIHNGWSKWILRNAMDKELPENIVWRRDKKGFPTPERKWMMDLKIDFMKLANESGAEIGNYFNISKITQDYEKILSDPEIKSHFLWKIYNFMKWRKLFNVNI